jgi:hypothetical protein
MTDASAQKASETSGSLLTLRLRDQAFGLDSSEHHVPADGGDEAKRSRGRSNRPSRPPNRRPCTSKEPKRSCTKGRNPHEKRKPQLSCVSVDQAPKKTRVEPREEDEDGCGGDAEGARRNDPQG